MNELERTIKFFIALLLCAMFIMLWQARSQHALASLACDHKWTAHQLYGKSWLNTLTLGIYGILKAGPLRTPIQPENGLLQSQ